MASTRKSRNVSKRFAKVNDEWFDREGTDANKSRVRKRKLSDMLGSQWSKEELERFYEAYRKYGKDWKKVAGAIRNRSSDMVEALYNMNRAYLSLPEGTATAAGLIAMMTDHYNILEGSESDRESNDVRTSRKPQKRGRGKFKHISKRGDEPSDLSRHQSAQPSYGCLSLLKKKRSGGLFAEGQPRVVGKRTPRVPVSNMCDKDSRMKTVSPNKQGFKSEASSADDEGAHVAALALAEASQRGGSPQVSRTPSRRMGQIRSSPQSTDRKNAESPRANSKFVTTDGEGQEGSLGSREAENAEFNKDGACLMDSEDFGAAESQQKVRKFQEKRHKSAGTEDDQFDDDEREACSGTEEGLNVRQVKDENEKVTIDGKSARLSKDLRARGRQLFSRDESSALDALQTLADLSVNVFLPVSTIESESSVQVKEEKRIDDVDEKPIIAELFSTGHQRDRSRVYGKRERGSSSNVLDGPQKIAKLVKGLPQDLSTFSEPKKQIGASISKAQKKRRKSFTGKITKSESSREPQIKESQKTVNIEDGKKSMGKGKRVSQIGPLPKQGKLIKLPERTSSTTDVGKPASDANETTVQVSATNHVVMAIKSRRKMDLQKVLAHKELKSSEHAGDDIAHSSNNKTFDLKNKLSHCLSSGLLRRWCMYEWFYSAIDYPWFAKSEFVAYLHHVQLGHVPRLSRVEWGVIRSSLGKPRRLSNQFLREEREKLEQYRESVRAHYAELRAGVKEGLPTDLARPLSVGQRVIACHPKTREIHDGSVLTVDRNRCRVQFDRPELGVEFVMDIDCMPVNPSENMPEALRGQNILVEKFCNSFIDTKLEDQQKDWKVGLHVKSAPSESSDIPDGVLHLSSSHPLSTLMKQANGDTVDAILQAKAAANEVAAAAQQVMYSQPCTLAQLQAREADIRALAELTRALDKKEALLRELKHMNEEVSAKQKDGDPIKDLEHFRKQYAMVLLQLKDANDQVASALFYLRQRNAYHGNSTPSWLRPMEHVEGPAGHVGPFNHSAFLNQDPGSHVVEIIESSRRKARIMVGAAVQVMYSLKEGEDAFLRIGEALDLTNNRNPGSGPSVSAVRYCPADQGHGNSQHQDHTSSCTSEPTAVHAFNSKLHISSNGIESQVPSELITSCIATLLMMQTCTERQYPPGEVAQILDSAVITLQPCCQQNLPIYREIETCMGIIKNQMLALIPTPCSMLAAEASII